MKKKVFSWLAIPGVVLIYLAQAPLNSRIEANGVAGEQTYFEIDWENYHYMATSQILVERNTPVHERYYMRYFFRDLILQKISIGLENLYVDSSHKIMDILDANNEFKREYPLYLEAMELTRVNFRNNYIEVSTSLPLRGNKGLIGKLPLPWQTLAYAGLTEAEYVGEAYESRVAESEYRGGIVPIAYTGLLIDLRGMDVNQALAPRIYSQSGRLIYGPEYIIKEIGVQRGVASYVKSLNDYEVKNRAGEKPYFAVALSTKGKFKTDAVISDMDTAKAFEHEETLNNLLKCRVVFIVD